MPSLKNKYLITIVGPTAIGKTALSISVANHFNAEIISCDSRQFYKEMTIGTAVPSIKELNSAKHHFIQNRSIFEEYSVGEFERDALATLNQLFTKNDVVVMVGGSGLYVDARNVHSRIVFYFCNWFPIGTTFIHLSTSSTMN